MSEAEYHQLRELSWRRKLSPDEEIRLQSWLAEHPAAQADAEAEASLSQLLRQLPDAPVATNFTARVVQAVERQVDAPARAPLGSDWFQRWKGRLARRAAWAALALALLLLAQQQYQSLARQRMANDLRDLSRALAFAEPKLLQDFEAIQRLGQVPPVVDEELWVALNNSEANNP